MALDTDTSLRNKMIYSIYVRNHTKEGTFQAVIPDLARIRGLGTDIIWLMPIHPIGEVMRKGTLGSPYAISDFRGVNPEYGTPEDFEELVAAARELGMKVMIDVVYNHTSPDSILVKEHPEWFYRRPNGRMGNKVGEWYDVVDLDYAHQELWDYQIETLKMWAEKVDGFRCDVASLVPLEFWLRARKEVAEVNPDAVWLAESVHPKFLRQHRDRKNVGLSDNEVFQAFDMTYDYDVHDFFEDYLWKEISLKHYMEILMFQDGIYPINYVKLKFLENHDHPRFRSYVQDPASVRNWTAFLYFQKGATLLYAGQERGVAKLPDLFNKDTVPWEEADIDLSPLMQKLCRFKQEPCLQEGSYSLEAGVESNAVVGRYTHHGKTIHGIFSLDGEPHVVQVDAPNGTYNNHLDDEPYTVRDGVLLTRGEPILFAHYHEPLLHD
ncbi:alpha-amylase family glycosyl hydrolase [Jeotgalibaca caeni]|uniref:alpha-amylase family glycosyl hydrolase n=1 Tax=Jeotgalibaca caeni TaxID=3028623 RepID=UPI00237D53CC|nr:alpha-amylase family glycosyl hydrolase [Jeotgalibaca caeni]MDE1548194.1 alpha-amylase family glycosyl hydrolase [Jeotgalibaca caeni]